MNEGYRLADEFLSLPRARELCLTDARLARFRQGEDRQDRILVCGAAQSGKSTMLSALLKNWSWYPFDSPTQWPVALEFVYQENPVCEVIWRTPREVRDLEDWFLEQGFPSPSQECPGTIQVSLECFREWFRGDHPAGAWLKEVKIGLPSSRLRGISFRELPTALYLEKPELLGTFTMECTASVFLSYASRALNQMDLEMADQLLLAIPKNRCLVFLGKADHVEDPKALLSWTDALSQKEEFRNMTLFQMENSFHLMCAEGALESVKNCGETDYAGWHEAGRNGFEELNRFLDGLNRSATQMRSLYRLAGLYAQEAVDQLGTELLLLEEKLGSVRASGKELTSDLEREVGLLSRYEESVSRFETALDAETRQILKRTEKRLEGVEKSFLLRVEEGLQAVSGTKELPGQFPWIVRHALECHRQDLEEAILGALGSFREIGLALTEILTEELNHSFQTGAFRVRELMDESVELLVAGFVEWMEAGLDLRTIQQELQKSSTLLNRIFASGGKLKKSREKVLLDLQAVVREALHTLHSHLQSRILPAVDEIWEEMSTDTQRLKRDLVMKIENLEKIRKTLLGQKKSLEGQIQRVKEDLGIWEKVMEDSMTQAQKGTL